MIRRFSMHPPLKTSLHCAVDNCVLRVPLVLHSGAAGSMLVAGEERWSRYLPDRFFESEPRERRHLGSYWTWQLPRALRRWRDAADVTVARADCISSRLFPAAEYLRIPEWLRMVAPVPASNNDFTASSVRSDMRVVKNNRLTWRVSHDPDELATYLDRDYYPYTRLRHGDDAFVQPPRWMRNTFRKGGLLWVEKEGVPIAGLVFEQERNVFRLSTVACVGADEAHLRAGALAGVYLFSFDCARSLGLTVVDMRGTRPCLHDPLFFVKRKYGGEVANKPDNAYDLLVRWNRASPAVMRFLAESPLIFRDGSGLSAIHADRVTPRRRLMVPGLRRLFTPRPDAPFGAWDEDRGDESAADR
jgi:hypothetical protein